MQEASRKTAKGICPTFTSKQEGKKFSEISISRYSSTRLSVQVRLAKGLTELSWCDLLRVSTTFLRVSTLHCRPFKKTPDRPPCWTLLTYTEPSSKRRGGFQFSRRRDHGPRVCFPCEYGSDTALPSVYFSFRLYLSPFSDPVLKGKVLRRGPDRPVPVSSERTQAKDYDGPLLHRPVTPILPQNLSPLRP